MIRDLLWACVVCGNVESLEPLDKKEICRTCGAVYARGSGSHIVVTEKGSAPVEKSALEWSRLLPVATAEGSAACTIRMARKEYQPIHAYGTYMGRHEEFGEPVHGTLSVDADIVRFNGSPGFHWSLLDLTAIQLSSSTLQLKAKRQPLVTIRFDSSSPKMWEERLQRAVQAAHRKAGHGDIVEYQPRIVTR